MNSDCAAQLSRCAADAGKFLAAHKGKISLAAAAAASIVVVGGVVFLRFKFAALKKVVRSRYEAGVGPFDAAKYPRPLNMSDKIASNASAAVFSDSFELTVPLARIPRALRTDPAALLTAFLQHSLPRFAELPQGKYLRRAFAGHASAGAMTPATIKALPMAVDDALLGCYRVLARDGDGGPLSSAATARLQMGMAEACDAKPGEGIKGALLFSATIAAGAQPTIADAAAALAAAAEADTSAAGEVDGGSVTLTTTTVMWDDGNDAADAHRLPMRFRLPRWMHAFTAMHLLKAPTDDLATETAAEEEMRRRYAAFEREMAARSTLHHQVAEVEADEASQKAMAAAGSGTNW